MADYNESPAVFVTNIDCYYNESPAVFVTNIDCYHPFVVVKFNTIIEPCSDGLPRVLLTRLKASQQC